AVGVVENHRVLAEVGRALEQRRVVHPGDAQRGAGEVGGDRGQAAAHDPALATAVVVEPGAVDNRLPVHLEGGIGVEARRMDHRPPQVEEVEHALLEPVGGGVEVRYVGQHRDVVGNVLLGQADPIGGAEHDGRPGGQV